jgi:tetratricopeptide (TPR) repeat protein
MSLTSKRALLGLITLLPLLAACWLLVAGARPFAPPLEKVQALVTAGRVEEARAAIEGYLRKVPRDPKALVVAAELALHDPEPDPRRALAFLEKVDSADRKLAARVRLDQGRAWEGLGSMAEAESAWREALTLDPQIPEAGWSLLGLYYLQGREDEARRTALTLHRSEPDPHDRVQLLLELVRQDARPPDPGSIVEIFTPIVAAHPGDRRSAVALGLGLIRASRIEQGVELLRRTVQTQPDDLRCVRALLLGLEMAGQDGEVAQVLEGLTESQVSGPGFDRFKGRAAEARGDWAAAAESYLRACAHEPTDNSLAYRAGRVLKLAGRAEEAGRWATRARTGGEDSERIRELFDRADEQMQRFQSMAPDLMLELADLRDRTKRPEEASAWRRLASLARRWP